LRHTCCYFSSWVKPSGRGTKDVLKIRTSFLKTPRPPSRRNRLPRGAPVQHELRKASGGGGPGGRSAAAAWARPPSSRARSFPPAAGRGRASLLADADACPMWPRARAAPARAPARKRDCQLHTLSEIVPCAALGSLALPRIRSSFRPIPEAAVRRGSLHHIGLRHTLSYCCLIHADRWRCFISTIHGSGSNPPQRNTLRKTFSNLG
jgi:hypothetical protein